MHASNEHENQINDSINEYRNLNSLVFSRPSSGSLISERCQKASFCSSAQYAMGSTINAIINVSQEVWGPGSYLKLNFTSDIVGSFGYGSVLSLFSSVRLYHRSGEQLSQILNIDVLGRLRLLYETSKSDYTLIQEKLWAPATPGSNDAPAFQIGPNFAIIPLSLIDPIFGVASSYIPSALLAGARIEIILNQNNSIGVDNNQSPSTAIPQISNIVPVFSFDTVTVFDSVKRALVAEQADTENSGLQFTYNTFFSSIQPWNSGTLNIDILQSCSMVESAFIVIRDTSSSSPTTVSRQLRFLPLTGASTQFRLGSSYRPLYVVDQPLEQYELTVQAAGYTYHNNTTMSHQKGVCVPSFGASSAVYGSSFERNSDGLVFLSYEPTNNARIINFNAVNCTGFSGTTQAYVFLKYARVANVMLDSCVVDR